MSVAFDATSTPTGVDGVTTVDLTTLTVGAGALRALVVQLSFNITTISALTVTWDQGGSNQACALIKSQSNGAGNNPRVELWGLVNPVAGNKTLRVSWTTGSSVIVNAFSVTGAKQDGGATTFANAVGATGSSTTPSVTVASAVGDMTADVTGKITSGAPTAPSQTSVFSLSEGSGPQASGGSRAAGAASNVHSWTTDSTPWASAGCSIVADTGGAIPQSNMMPLLGVG